MISESDDLLSIVMALPPIRAGLAMTEERVLERLSLDLARAMGRSETDPKLAVMIDAIKRTLGG